MKVSHCSIKGLIIIEPDVWEDHRGYFFESYNAFKYGENGLVNTFVQDNESKSKYGVIRGLHYQVDPYGQAKLVRAVVGEILDVVVDIRPSSETYGHHYSIILSDQNKKQLYIPNGFAHGYAVLSSEAVFSYKCDNFYSKEHEGGILFNDPSLKIDWMIPQEDQIISSKDLQQPIFDLHRKNEQQ